MLVSNAAMLLETPLDDTDDAWDDKWSRTWDVNVRASADLTRDAVRHFRERGGGVLIDALELGRAAWLGQPATCSPTRRRRARSTGS